MKLRVGPRILLAIALVSSEASPQQGAIPPPHRGFQRPPPAITSVPTHPLEPTNELRAHFGTELAARLIESSDPEERLRGLERAAADESGEGTSLLVRSLGPSGAARYDPRALLAVTRGLASHAKESAARSALADIVNSPPSTTRSPAPQEDLADAPAGGPDPAARIELARATAAFALASAGDVRATDTLVALAGSSGGGQPYAIAALVAYPPSLPASLPPPGTPPMLKLAVLAADLRGLEGIRAEELGRDPNRRAALLLDRARVGDARAIEDAQAALREGDARITPAAVEALVRLRAPGRYAGLVGLLADPHLALAGCRLAQLDQDEAVVRALAARVAASGDHEVRAEGIVALGRSTSPLAVSALLELAHQPALASDAASALARSPSDGAYPALASLFADGSSRRLATRALAVRALVRGDRSAQSYRAFEQMAGAGDAKDRSVGLFAEVALGRIDVGRALLDPDAGVRRAVAIAAMALPAGTFERALLDRLATEPDAMTQRVLATGLVAGDPEGRISTTALVERAESGAADAPLAALAFARRADAARRQEVDALLTSRDPLLRAHCARGLGASDEPDAIGRLAAAYAYEPQASVRRALVRAIAQRTRDGASPERAATLALAAKLDPDFEVRASASRALSGKPAFIPGAAGATGAAWLHLEDKAESPTPRGVVVARLVRSDGVAVPIAFDEDGYAIVPIPPGEARILLAPRPASYEASSP